MISRLYCRFAPTLATALFACGCAAPSTLARPRSALLNLPPVAMTPEARIARLSTSSRGVPHAASTNESGEAEDGDAIAASARRMLGRTDIEVNGRQYPADCTGLVRAVFAEHGIDLLAEGSERGENAVSAIHRFASRHGTLHERDPAPGDIVFFRETYDRNRDGRRNDGLTHVGIVDAVDPDGAVYVIHRVARGVVRYRLDLRHPDVRQDASGRVLNDWMRTGRDKRLAGELCAGFATIVRR